MVQQSEIHRLVALWACIQRGHGDAAVSCRIIDLEISAEKRVNAGIFCSPLLSTRKASDFLALLES